MVTEYITLKAGERLRVSDQVFIVDEQSWKTVDKHVAKYGMIVAPGSLCRRPVGVSVPDDAAGEWEEEETEDGLTSEEELENELAEANQQIKKLVEENMELHNRLQTMKDHVDSLKKQLVALEEKLKAEEKISAVFTKSAEQERTRLITERDNLRQEVHNLQHSLAVERRRLESLDVGSAERDRKRKESGK